ncbi:hypothetical protein B0H63DRAFT_525817 [Podospora didyma]|uniref:CCHC-type domain-containing protein n=1 Tax=Podospora didyma TaxID=330526 RepID=A0AAE0NDD0_9PEZI|nr:hypothetical protein B0H63DRAFT_525817 [Podospora didyma]
MDVDAAIPPVEALVEVPKNHNSAPEPGLNLDKSSASKKRAASETDVGRDSAKENTTSGRKRTKLDDSKSPTGSDAFDEGEIRDPSPVSELPQTSKTVSERQQEAHNGWNRGINNGLRTSFGSSIKNKAPQNQAPSPVVPQGTGIPDATEDDDLVVSRWVMPQGFDKFRKRLKSTESWQGRFEEWRESLINLNQGQEGVQDPALLKNSWDLWIRDMPSMGKGQKATARKVVATELQPQTLKEVASDAGVPEPPNIQGPPNSLMLQANPLVDSAVAERGARKKERMKKSAPSTGDDGGWPPLPLLPLSEFQIQAKDVEGWHAKFAQWLQTVIQLNSDQMVADTPELRGQLNEAYSKWIESHKGLSRNKSTWAKRAANDFLLEGQRELAGLLPASAPVSQEESGFVADAAAFQQEENAGVVRQNSLLKEEQQTQSNEAQSAPSPATDYSGHVPASRIPPDEGNPEYRDTYFPGVAADAIFCVMCASHGHISAECPQMACRFCHTQDHRSHGCSTRQRCSKCKQLGHSRKQCREKLALPKEEMVCALCDSQGHTEAYCARLWRTFLPNPETVKKVNALLVYCYSCGGEGHYGPECGLNPWTPMASGETWSKANRDQYLDPSSSRLPIALDIEPDSILSPSIGSGRPDFGGKSIVPQRHIVFESADDDDENESFIRPPVQKKPRPAKINFSSGNGNQNRGANKFGGNGGSTFTPPLPPGPLLPANGYYRPEPRRPNTRGGNTGWRTRSGNRRDN